MEKLTLIHNDYEAVLEKIELFIYIDNFYMAKAEIDQLMQKVTQTEEKISKLVIALGAVVVMIISLTIMMIN
ncbi:unnamed protein product [Thlaspi arvense]|uniref:Uncharacterized protein n=1 Tax=Thlaspi arvense TaxID=13288 RepID=A0AAU9SAH4_THLAR|nr:unnamed protein product [Thlaspi arvense]